MSNNVSKIIRKTVSLSPDSLQGNDFSSFLLLDSVFKNCPLKITKLAKFSRIYKNKTNKKAITDAIIKQLKVGNVFYFRQQLKY